MKTHKNIIINTIIMNEPLTIEIFATKVYDAYILHWSIVDIFTEDAKQAYEDYLVLHHEGCVLYGKQEFSDCCIKLLNNIPGFCEEKLPILVRQFTFKGNSSWSLAKMSHLYEMQAKEYLKKNNQEAYDISLLYAKKYKIACIYKYGNSVYEEEHERIQQELLPRETTIDLENRR